MNDTMAGLPLTDTTRLRLSTVAPPVTVSSYEKSWPGSTCAGSVSAKEPAATTPASVESTRVPRPAATNCTRSAPLLVHERVTVLPASADSAEAVKPSRVGNTVTVVVAVRTPAVRV